MRQPISILLSALFWSSTLSVPVAQAQQRNDVWQLDLSSNTWTQLFPSNGPPAPRRFFAHAYDSQRNRLVLLGGQGDNSVLYSDAWALDLANPGAEAWTHLGFAQWTVAFRPGLYDSLRDWFVVVDRADHCFVLRLSSYSWSSLWNLGNADPLQTTTHSAVYDASNDRYLVFGGGSGTTAVNRVRVLNPSAIQRQWYDLLLAPPSPAPRGLAGTVYDPFMQRLILFGGAPLGGFGVGGISVNDTWELGLTAGSEAWSQLTPSQAPPDRAQHAVAFDMNRRRMLIFGGLRYYADSCSSQPKYVAFNDAWALSSDGATWTQLDPGGEGVRPDYRRGAGAVYDQQHDRLIVFGGEHFTPPSTTIPAAPSDLQAVPTSPRAVNLSWIDKATDEEGYRLVRRTNNGPAELIAELPADSTSYVDANVQPCDTYAYAVRAFRYQGVCLLQSSDSNVATAAIPCNSPPVAVCTYLVLAAGSDCMASTTSEEVGSGSYDPDGDPISFQLFPPGPYPVGSTPVTLMVMDPAGASDTCEATITVVDETPPALTITSPPSGALYQVGTAVTFTGTFVENCALASVSWRLQSNVSNTEVTGTIDAEARTVSATHTFLLPGVYVITLNAVDAAGNSATATTVGGVDGLPAFVVVYDPDAGFVTGGGWIDSPAGAYAADPTLTGKASFGFVSRYKKGANVPDGNTEFQFRAGDLNFHSHSYDWLVIAGSRAQFKGDGTINGQGSYRFMITAIDGGSRAEGGADKFRIRIWDDDGLVYDNQLNAPDSDDPTTVIGGGSIVIHK